MPIIIRILVYCKPVVGTRRAVYRVIEHRQTYICTHVDAWRQDGTLMPIQCTTVKMISMIVIFPTEGKRSMNGRPCMRVTVLPSSFGNHAANDRSNLLVPKEAHDLGCNLLRAEPRSILPLHQESQVTRPRAKLFHLYHPGSDLQGPLERQIRQAETYLAQYSKGAQFVIRKSHLRLGFVVLLPGGKR
jgi:hypothetical protein